MTVTKSLAVAATFAVVAVGAATPASAAPEMSGHYLLTETAANGRHAAPTRGKTSAQTRAAAELLRIFPRSTPLEIRVSARLHPFWFARHLRGATVRATMLTCIYPACEHLPCGRLSGEYSPVSERFDASHCRGDAQA
jgi:hypothetical protein